MDSPNLPPSKPRCPPKDWGELHDILLSLEANELVHVALVAAELVVPIWDSAKHPGRHDEPSKALQCVRQWLKGEVGYEELRVAADAAYEAARSSDYGKGIAKSSPVRAAAFSAAHAAYAAHFLARPKQQSVDTKQKVFEAARAACSSAVSAAQQTYWPPERVNPPPRVLDDGTVVYPVNHDIPEQWSERWWTTCCS